MSAAAAAAAKLKKLRSEALTLSQNGDHRGALKRLAALESLDPSEPDWPRRAAECHRLLGEKAEQLEALARAANGYVSTGVVVKAMAICKMMLALDPTNSAALDWLRQLQPPLGFERVAIPVAPASPGPAPVAGVAAAAAARRAPDAAQDQRLAAPSSPEMPPPLNDAQRLLKQRGLVAVARAVARRSGRQARGMPDVPIAEAPEARIAKAPEARIAQTEARIAEVPEAPIAEASSMPAGRATAASGNWQLVDEAELLEASVPPPGGNPSLPPASISLPPLSVDTELHNLIPGSSAVAVGRKPSGMFRLDIDDAQAPPARTEQTLQHARQVLPAVPLFSELDPATLESLVRGSQLLSLEPGATIIRQNDLPQALYVVVNGSVSVVDQSSADLELYRLGENEFFGESALISNEPHPTTVRAAEACDVLAFDREAMRTCIARNRSVVPVLLRFLRSRMVEQLVRTSPLFTHFSTAERRALTRKFEFVEVPESATLVQQGEMAPGLFVLLSGAVDVTLEDDGREQWLATLERGGVFGEMSLLHGSTATATVRSISAGFALLLPASTFRDIVLTHRPLLQVLTHLSEERGDANRRRTQAR